MARWLIGKTLASSQAVSGEDLRNTRVNTILNVAGSDTTRI